MLDTSATVVLTRDEMRMIDRALSSAIMLMIGGYDKESLAIAKDAREKIWNARDTSHDRVMATIKGRV